MNLFDVYPLYNINIVKGDGCKVWDENGIEYLDLYGGHAVISIGHAHPHYVAMIIFSRGATLRTGRQTAGCCIYHFLYGSECRFFCRPFDLWLSG